ncbi:thioredoxin domain-containing protein [Acidianus sp. HS-5]|nr:thioredoxin domain-containing protein [Acidianus sp. HS-5]
MAKKENKLILVDIGAAWCHWCHVMDDETYSNSEIAKVVNENFIAIKVDRDEMPDVDRKLQLIVSQISGESGWPLTVFMTPEGNVFFGGTFFPPEDSYGRIGFKRLLNEILKLWNNERDKILNSSIPLSIKVKTENEGNLNKELIESSFSILTSAYDLEYGGLGNNMKFPHPKVDEFMLAYSAWTGDDLGKKLNNFTLTKMFEGGIFDQVGGGFHRYTTDREWLTPHFEKLLIDNAELLEDYYISYLATGKAEFLEAYNLTYEFIKRDLENSVAFSNSIDADSDGVEGGYYTWTEEEIRNALGEEYELGIKLFGLRKEGGVVEGRKILRTDLSEAKRLINSNIKVTLQKLRDLRKKMLEYRQKNRKFPRVDENSYSYPNYRLAEVLFSSLKVEDGMKIIKYLTPTVTRRLNGGKEGLLEDYATALLASISAYEVTAEEKYYSLSLELYSKLKDFLKDDGFEEPNGELPYGEMPNESPNSLAIRGILKLSLINRIDVNAEKILSNLVNSDPSFVSGLLLSAGSLINGIAHVVIVDEKDGNAESLHKEALTTYYPLKVVEKISDDIKDRLDLSLRAMLNDNGGKSRAYICIGNTCSMPIFEMEKIKLLLKTKLS